MDGYAFVYQDPMPATLKRVGEVLAGHQYSGTLNVGETVRIMTGATVPVGADTVQPRELAKEVDEDRKSVV